MHVAGICSSETGYGWATLATTFITGLRVQDVVTADLAFAQISTQHPFQGHVPSISFLGTRFENLRIAGREVQPVLDLGVCGARPEGDKPYGEDAGFLSRVSRRHENINTALGLSDSAPDKYHWAAEEGSEAGKVECSLVTSVGQAEPGTSFGHIVEVPGGGAVHLAELTVDRVSFHLAMFSVQAGKPHKKKIVVGYTNGRTSP